MQIFSQIVVSELFTIDNPLGLRMMKCPTLMTPLPPLLTITHGPVICCQPGSQPLLCITSRAHSSIHHSGIILSLLSGLYSPDKTVDNAPGPPGQITGADECEGWRHPRGLASTRGPAT